MLWVPLKSMPVSAYIGKNKILHNGGLYDNFVLFYRKLETKFGNSSSVLRILIT